MSIANDGKWLQSVGLVYRLNGGTNYDEVSVTMANGSRASGPRADRAATILAMLEKNDRLTASHAALLAALEEAEAIIAKNTYPCPDKPNSTWGKLESMRAAIKTAKELG